MVADPLAAGGPPWSRFVLGAGEGDACATGDRDHVVWAGVCSLRRAAGRANGVEHQAGIEAILRGRLLIDQEIDDAVEAGANVRASVGETLAAQAIRVWRGNQPPVTAVGAYNDELALALLAGLRSLELEAPRDLALVGIDDIPQAKFAAPPLTTVR